MSDRIAEVRAQLLKRHQDIREAISPGISRWLERNARLPNGEFDSTKIVEVAKYIGTSYEKEIEEIAASCFSREIFPDMPAVKLYGCDGIGDNIWDVWLMIWRPGRPLEATMIHDHDDSCAGIYVVQGEVSEYVYEVSAAHWKEGIDPLPFVIWRRRLLAGESTFIGVPYIHRMMDHRVQGCSVHVYGNPPLDFQRTYVIAGDMLYKDGSWSEVGVGDCR